MSNLVIHLGYHKTGTTFLQNSVFYTHPDIKCIGHPDKDYKDSFFRKQILDASDAEFAKNCYDIKQFLADTIDNGNHSIAVLSDEDFSMGRLFESYWQVLPFEALKRLKKIAPEDSRVIITLRNQYGLIPSLYNHFLKMNLTRCDMESWVKNKIYNDNFSMLSAFLFHPMISEVYRLFGRDRTKILFYEDLRDSPAAFLSTLAPILNLPANSFESYASAERVNIVTRSESFYISFRRRIPDPIFLGIQNLRQKLGFKPGAFQKWIRRLDPQVFESRSSLTSELREWIENYYGPDNRELDALLGGQLRERGYPGTAPSGEGRANRDSPRITVKSTQATPDRKVF